MRESEVQTETERGVKRDEVRNTDRVKQQMRKTKTVK